MNLTVSYFQSFVINLSHFEPFKSMVAFTSYIPVYRPASDFRAIWPACDPLREPDGNESRNLAWNGRGWVHATTFMEHLDVSGNCRGFS